LYKTGVQREKVNYKKIADHREFFNEMIENVYRYEQFYGNIFLAFLFNAEISRWERAHHSKKSDMVMWFISFVGNLIFGVCIRRTHFDLLDTANTALLVWRNLA